MRRLSYWSYGLAVLVVTLDQALKYWILNVYRLPDRLMPTVIGPMRLSMVWNRGVSFGFLGFGGEAGRWGLTVFSLAVAACLAVWARRVEKPLLAVAISLIIGGAVGNAIDRVRLGAVTDFIDFSRLWFPWVFNIADSAITVGVILILCDGLFGAGRPARR